MDRERIKLELKEDQILEILLHAATREDIAKLDNKIEMKVDNLATAMKDGFAKADARMDKLDAKIDTKADNLDAKIDTKIDALDAKIDRLHAETKSYIVRVDAKIDKVIWFIMVSILVPIILHFMK